MSSFIDTIDLTLDDDDDEMDLGHPEPPQGPSTNTPANAPPPPRLEPPKLTLPPKISKSEVLSFSSYEIKRLSQSRINHNRLPDIIQNDQKKSIINSAQQKIFLGYLKEHEESSAPLTITNEFNPDIEPIPPANFAYTDGYILTEGLEKPSRKLYNQDEIPMGCSCHNDSGVCDPHTCECYQLHERLASNPWRFMTKTDEQGKDYTAESDFRGKFAYKDGRLVSDLVAYAQTPIWECNSNCGCTEDCQNRLVQKGRTIPMDLRRSKNKGWTVHYQHERKNNNKKPMIKAGTFVTVYSGELIDWNESEIRGIEYDKTSLTYCLDIDNHHIRKALYLERYLEMCTKTGQKPEEDEDELLDAASTWAEDVISEKETTLSIDAGLWGNLSRYFSHSCEPTMSIYPVYTEERDIRRPFQAFFTKFDLADGDELTFDYGGANAVEEKVARNDMAELTEKLQSREAGTEITVKTLEKGHNLTSMKCGCGSVKCRGFVFFGK